MSKTFAIGLLALLLSLMPFLGFPSSWEQWIIPALGGLILLTNYFVSGDLSAYLSRLGNGVLEHDGAMVPLTTAIDRKEREHAARRRDEIDASIDDEIEAEEEADAVREDEDETLVPVALVDARIEQVRTQPAPAQEQAMIEEHPIETHMPARGRFARRRTIGALNTTNDA